MEKTGTDCLGLVQVSLKFSLVHSQGQHYWTGIHIPRRSKGKTDMKPKEKTRKRKGKGKTERERKEEKKNP